MVTPTRSMPPSPQSPPRQPSAPTQASGREDQIIYNRADTIAPSWLSASSSGSDRSSVWSPDTSLTDDDFFGLTCSMAALAARSSQQTPPRTRPEEQVTPVSKFIQDANAMTPDHTFASDDRALQAQALASAKNRRGEAREAALQKLGRCYHDAMARSGLLQVVETNEHVTAVYGWRDFMPCWPASGLQQVGGSIILDLSHLSALQSTEGGRSVKGMHLHSDYLPNAYINPQTGVWCASQAIVTDRADFLRGAKFSTFFPLICSSEKAFISLVTDALNGGTVIAQKNSLSLIQPANSPFVMEIAIRDNIIRTVFPVMAYASYDPAMVLSFDRQDGTTYQISLEAVVEHMRSEFKLDSDEIRYICDNGDLIIDIAPFDKGPIEKGILVRFPQGFML